MPIRISVSRNFGKLAALDLVTKADMRELGLLARERIVRRTRAGKDVDNSPFAAYKPGYAALKAAAVGGGGKVNLTLSGRMLNELTVLEVTKDSVKVGWRG